MAYKARNDIEREKEIKDYVFEGKMLTGVYGTWFPDATPRNEVDYIITVLE